MLSLFVLTVFVAFSLQFSWPGLDTSNTSYNISYTVERYPQLAHGQLQYGMADLYSRGANVLSIDAGFKLCKEGLTTAMNDKGFIVAYYLNTSSILTLAPLFARFGLRSKALGKVRSQQAGEGYAGITDTRPCRHDPSIAVQVVRIVYVDNPEHTGKILKLTFPGLGQELFPGDSGVRWDEFHMIQMLRETTVGGHPCWEPLLNSLLAVLHVQHPQDKAAAEAAEAAAKPRPPVRHMVPPPHVLLPQLLAWANRWCQQGLDPITGEHIFTLQTWSFLAKLFKACINWRLSDPWIMEGDHYVPYDMYVITPLKGSEGHAIHSKRGSSKNESWHRASNNTVQATNAGRALLATSVLQRASKWNQERAEKLGELDPPGHYQLHVLAECNDAAKAIGLPEPFPTVRSLSAMPTFPGMTMEEQLRSQPEQHGFQWEEQDAASADAPDGQPPSERQYRTRRLKMVQEVQGSPAATIAEQRYAEIEPEKEGMHNAPAQWLRMDPSKQPQPTSVPAPEEYIPRDQLEAYKAKQAKQQRHEDATDAADEEAAQMLIDLGSPTVTPSKTRGSARRAAATAAVASPAHATAATATAGGSKAAMAGGGASSSRTPGQASPGVGSQVLILHHGTSRRSAAWSGKDKAQVGRLPNTHAPVTTPAEMQLFANLLPTGPKHKPDYMAMAQQFNQHFVLQVHKGVESPDLVINSKSPKQLRKFHAQLQQGQANILGHFFQQALATTTAAPQQAGRQSQAVLRQSHMTAFVPSMGGKRGGPQQQTEQPAKRVATTGAGGSGAAGATTGAGGSGAGAAGAATGAGGSGSGTAAATGAGGSGAATATATGAGAEQVSKTGYVCMDCLLLCQEIAFKGASHQCHAKEQHPDNDARAAAKAAADKAARNAMKWSHSKSFDSKLYIQANISKLTDLRNK